MEVIMINVNLAVTIFVTYSYRSIVNMPIIRITIFPIIFEVQRENIIRSNIKNIRSMLKNIQSK